MFLYRSSIQPTMKKDTMIKAVAILIVLMFVGTAVAVAISSMV